MGKKKDLNLRIYPLLFFPRPFVNMFRFEVVGPSLFISDCARDSS